MSGLPLVSVVIPCHNRAHYLVPTIESVLQQNYPFVECIVVDGGSTDGTQEILKSYGDLIRWVSKPDNGHADAINQGWWMSKGDILAWLNADDLYVIPDAIGKAATYLHSNPNVDFWRILDNKLNNQSNIQYIPVGRSIENVSNAARLDQLWSRSVKS